MFDAVWQEHRDIGDPGVLASCLARAGRDSDLVDRTLLPDARTVMADATTLAFATPNTQRDLYAVPQRHPRRAAGRVSTQADALCFQDEAMIPFSIRTTTIYPIFDFLNKSRIDERTSLGHLRSRRRRSN